MTQRLGIGFTSKEEAEAFIKKHADFFKGSKVRIVKVSNTSVRSPHQATYGIEKD